MIISAIETVLRSGIELTPDMGGKGNTEDLGKAIAAAM
jgi:isocitrate/isopropylmalate dehydrogenase